MYLNRAQDPWKLSHLVGEHLLASRPAVRYLKENKRLVSRLSTFHVSAVALSLSTVKHGSFLFAYFLEQMKKLKNNLKNCVCLGLYADILYILQLLTNEIN